MEKFDELFFWMADGGNVEVVELDGPIVKVAAGPAAAAPAAPRHQMGIERKMRESIPEERRPVPDPVRQIDSDRWIVFSFTAASRRKAPIIAGGAHRERDGCVAGYERIERNGYLMLRRGRCQGVVEGEVYAIAPDFWPGLDHQGGTSVYQRCQVHFGMAGWWLYSRSRSPA